MADVTEQAPPSTGPVWPEIAADHPLSKLLAKLPELTKEADYSEVYGIDLSTGTDFQKKLILQKFLRANSDDLDKATTQLLETLKWRKSFNPLATRDETFSKAGFAGLGYVTTVSGVPGSPNERDVVTFNVYGAAAKDIKATFGDLDQFMRWRVGIMELSLAALDLPGATKPIPDFGAGPDPHQGIQVHDYLQVSFLRQNPDQRAAAKAAIDTFSKYYPETLSRKFFVNVPVVMGWFYNAVKLMLSAETVRKFMMLSYGSYLAGELGDGVPEAYGGKGPTLESTATQPKLEA
ncbi:hypothetical protein FH972_021833 [Carpinus fangiana]|uniref:Phosphatidylinositol transfer protein SFH5 n=1 Tax=Carpinus fangiana TaxID=176857 RepID=A0A5N6KSK8_9ROSI|nr:hypothetical protein FH972_021833 [Carpinus fangiana]